MPSYGVESSLRVINDELKCPNHNTDKIGETTAKIGQNSQIYKREINSELDRESIEINKNNKLNESFEEAPLWAAFITYIGYFVLNMFGWFRDITRCVGIEKQKGATDNNPKVINNML